MRDAYPVGVESWGQLLRVKSFTFNPYEVDAHNDTLPRVSPVAIHIQPLRGCQLFSFVVIFAKIRCT
jgi:hypothetical protein